MQSKGRERAASHRVRFRRSSMIAMVLFFVGVALECWMISMLFQVSPETHDQKKVVDATSENNPQSETQISISSIMNSISAMEDYSNKVRMTSFSDNNENILAGASGLDRRIILQSFFQQQFANSSASQLEYLAEMTIVNNQMSEEDYEALTRITEAETTGGDVMSKMLVASVVLNRVKDDRFPDTVYDVVFQGSQFSPVDDGSYYSCTVSDETREAIDRVFSGEDPSEGALFFVAKDSADSSLVGWFDSELTWLFNYGGHDFYTF